MLHSAPDFRHRSPLTELMDEPCSRDELRACLRDIAWTNRWTMAYWPTLHWLDTFTNAILPPGEPLRILDVGCGYGDSLRRIERWAKTRGIHVDLTGLDLNPDASAIAAEANSASSAIQWVSTDIFKFVPRRPFHIVVSSLFAHHLAEADIVAFLQWMERHATLGWFICDLARGAIPYYFFRSFSKLARLHPFVQYDGPVSIARSFVPEDWRSMCAAAGLAEDEIDLQTFKPARLCVARRMPQLEGRPS
jgi:SAM-dependent methyltransferase